MTDIKSTIRDFARKSSDTHKLGNQAYEMFERSSGEAIIKRDNSGNPIVGKSGYYLLTQNSTDNHIDAFRHAYSSAVTSRDYYTGFAHAAGDLLEWGEDKVGGNEANGAKNMDLWNNSIGRQYGTYGNSNDSISNSLYNDLINGRLITNTNDTRVYNGGSFLDNVGTSYFNDALFKLVKRAENAVESFFGPPGSLLNPIVVGMSATLFSARNRVSPLSLDLDNDGIETTHAYDDGEVYFDIDADGFKERVGWIDSDDGQLAYDTNGNGQIDDITELFGDDQMPAFEKLMKNHDSNHNGKIDQGDADYENLLVWRDVNQDGNLWKVANDNNNQSFKNKLAV